MKPKYMLPVVMLLGLLSSSLMAAPLGTAFTYQGQLADGGIAANGIYDLRFAIYDAVTNGSAVGGVLTNAATPVTNGLFTATLDFGPGVFADDARWLEIGVRTNSSLADFTDRDLSDAGGCGDDSTTFGIIAQQRSINELTCLSL